MSATQAACQNKNKKCCKNRLQYHKPPFNAHPLVSGFVGGNLYLQTGGASNYLCLPLQPELSTYVGGYQSGNQIYGAKYETGGMPNLFPVTCIINTYRVPDATLHTDQPLS